MKLSLVGYPFRLTQEIKLDHWESVTVKGWWSLPLGDADRERKEKRYGETTRRVIAAASGLTPATYYSSWLESSHFWERYEKSQRACSSFEITVIRRLTHFWLINLSLTGLLAWSWKISSWEQLHFSCLRLLVNCRHHEVRHLASNLHSMASLQALSVS